MLEKVVFISLIFLQFLFSQNSANDSSKTSSFVFLPVIYHTPETKLAAGALAVYNYRDENSSLDERPSAITPILVYTQKNQIIGELGFDLYFKKELYHFSGSIGYKIFPNTYFGIGNKTAEDNEEKYISNNFIASLTSLKRIQPSINVGLQYDFENLDITKKDSLLNINGTTGNDGGMSSGLGPVVHFDTRDNINFPSKGHFYNVSLLFYQSFLGSDFKYNSITLDLRKYHSFFADHIIAFQGYFKFTNGSVPFNKLALIGGSRIFRGYFEGRYRDKNLLFFQSEYRSPTWHNMGYIVFAGLGDVAAKINKFEPADFKYSFGFGLRYMFVPQEKLNLRLDFGFVEDGFQFYVNFAEAF